jgi:thiosulfate dehydrogenase
VASTIDILDAQGQVVGTTAPSADGRAWTMRIGDARPAPPQRNRAAAAGQRRQRSELQFVPHGRGKRPFGNHYFNPAAPYPRYMPRPGKVIGLAEAHQRLPAAFDERQAAAGRTRRRCARCSATWRG